MLNPIETEILRKLEERSHMNAELGNPAVDYYYQGNFVVCVLRDFDHEGLGLNVGISKRNPIDEDSVLIGENRAFNRAVRSLLGYYAK